MIGILGGMGTQAGLDFCNKLATHIEEKLIKIILFSFYITNQIFQEDQSLLGIQLGHCQTDLKIFRQKESMKKS